jgi:hypothetical protein
MHEDEAMYRGNVSVSGSISSLDEWSLSEDLLSSTNGQCRALILPIQPIIGYRLDSKGDQEQDSAN